MILANINTNITINNLQYLYKTFKEMNLKTCSRKQIDIITIVVDFKTGLSLKNFQEFPKPFFFNQNRF